MSVGHMIWKDKRIPVRDVVEAPRLGEHGVRDGWDATTGEGALEARMFYPADMFAFEPSGVVGEGEGIVAGSDAKLAANLLGEHPTERRRHAVHAALTEANKRWPGENRRGKRAAFALGALWYRGNGMADYADRQDGSEG